MCEGGGIGRRARLRGVWLYHASSSLVPRTTSEWTTLHSKSPAVWLGFSHTAPSFLLFPTKLCCANFRGDPALRAKEGSRHQFHHANATHCRQHAACNEFFLFVPKRSARPAAAPCGRAGFVLSCSGPCAAFCAALRACGPRGALFFLPPREEKGAAAHRGGTFVAKQENDLGRDALASWCCALPCPACWRSLSACCTAL